MCPTPVRFTQQSDQKDIPCCEICWYPIHFRLFGVSSEPSLVPPVQVGRRLAYSAAPLGFGQASHAGTAGSPMVLKCPNPDEHPGAWQSFNPFHPDCKIGLF